MWRGYRFCRLTVLTALLSVVVLCLVPAGCQPTASDQPPADDGAQTGSTGDRDEGNPVGGANEDASGDADAGGDADVDNGNVSGNDDAEPDDPVTDEDETEEPADEGPCDETDMPFTPIEDDSIWMIGNGMVFAPTTDTMLMIGGRGREVVSVTVGLYDYEGDTSCYGEGENLTVTFDGREVRIDGSVGGGPDEEGGCIVHVVATIEECGAIGFGIPFFDLSGEVSVVIGDVVLELSSVQFIPLDRLFETAPCDEPVESLDGSYWEVSSMDMLSGFFPVPEGDVTINLYGEDDVLDGGWFALGPYEDDGCYGYDGLEGTVHLDGDRLEIDVTFNEEDDASCSVRFSGTRTDCTLPPDFTYQSGQVMRFEGEGTYSGLGQDGVFDVLYISASEPYEDAWLEPESQPCDETPAGLDGLTWSVSPYGYDYDGVGFDENLGLDVYGMGDEVTYAELISYADKYTSCLPDLADVQVMYDGEQFELAFSSEGAGDPEDEYALEPCTVRFSGQVVACDAYGFSYGRPESYGFRVVRVEGEGSVGFGEEATPLGTLYLTLFDDPGDD
jgi:hypothetical protein